MNIILVSSALDGRNESLTKSFKDSGFKIQNKWLGTKDWPDFNSDLAGIVFLEDDRISVLESIVEARKQLRGSNSLPLVVVPNVFGPKVRIRYISAGATQVCSPDESEERIVAEIQSAFEFDSSETNQTRLELLQPFIAATIEALEIMASVKIEVDQVFRKKEYTMNGDISGLIYLTGRTERLLAVTFPEKSAKTMSVKILADTIIDPTTDMVADCVGEMVNIIAGQVKGRFVETEYEFDISTPTIISGVSHEIRHRTELPCYVMTFKGEIGDFSLQLCVRSSENQVEEGS